MQNVVESYMYVFFPVTSPPTSASGTDSTTVSSPGPTAAGTACHH